MNEDEERINFKQMGLDDCLLKVSMLSIKVGF